MLCLATSSAVASFRASSLEGFFTPRSILSMTSTRMPEAARRSPRAMPLNSRQTRKGMLTGKDAFALVGRQSHEQCIYQLRGLTRADLTDDGNTILSVRMFGAFLGQRTLTWLNLD